MTRKVTGGVVPKLFAAVGALSPDALKAYDTTLDVSRAD
jgi:hypothetical protein